MLVKALWLQAQLDNLAAQQAQASEIHEPLNSPELRELAVNIAQIHGIEDVWRFLAVAQCESGFDTTIRSLNILPNGKQENSWGLYQINLDVHDVTRAQAKDPYFAITWAADHWNDARNLWYTCYRASSDG